MTIKQKIAILGISLMSQGVFAQFTGTNPATLNGDAYLSGTMNVGSLLSPGGTTAQLNIFEEHFGFPFLGAPFNSYTTGMRLVHRYSSTGASYTNYNWDMGVNTTGLHFHYENINETIMSITRRRQVGIGTANTNATLHVSNFNSTALDAHLEGFTLLDGNQASLLLGAETGAPYGEWGIEYNTGAEGLNFWKPSGATTGFGNYHLFIKNNGKVSIGLDPTASTTFNGDYKLYVDKGILTEKVKVALKNTTDWADYVFDEDYELMPLSEVEQFVNKNHHLPGVPSAEEVKENGIDVATMDAKLLEKIEELTLHVIELEKRYKELEEKLEATKK